LTEEFEAGVRDQKLVIDVIGIFGFLDQDFFGVLVLTGH
jgi:hypothetical protein